MWLIGVEKVATLMMVSIAAHFTYHVGTRGGNVFRRLSVFLLTGEGEGGVGRERRGGREGGERGGGGTAHPVQVLSGGLVHLVRYPPIPWPGPDLAGGGEGVSRSPGVCKDWGCGWYCLIILMRGRFVTDLLSVFIAISRGVMFGNSHLSNLNFTHPIN